LDEEGLESLLNNNELVPEGFSAPEAIVLLEGRPSLLIQDGTFEDPSIDEIGQRLAAARDELLLAIRSVGRLEFLNHPRMSYAGTAWMIDEGVIIINPHVAQVFAENGKTSQ
jgi:endonuclease G